VDSSICTVERRVTTEMNDQLLAAFTIDEIYRALNQMSPLKAPRPNGFSASFYQQNWVVIHPEVCQAILHFLNSGVMDSSINITHIALIPKVDSPVSVT
jgi:hypothetical protein